MVSGCRGREAIVTYLWRFLANPWSVSSERILCKHDKFVSRCGRVILLSVRPQLGASHLIRDAHSTLCLILNLVLWNPKFTTAVEGGGVGIKPTLNASLRQTLLSPTKFMAKHVRQKFCVSNDCDLNSRLMSRLHKSSVVVGCFMSITVRCYMGS